MPEEIAVYLEDILRILGYKRAKFFRKRRELVDAGAIFYRCEGRRHQKRILAFPSRLKNWTGLKASQGEIL